MRFPVLIVAVAWSLAPGEALACMASGPEGYATGMIWERRPSDVPADAMVLRIRYVRSVEPWMGFIGEVKEGPRGTRGRSYRFLPQNLSSCVALGQREGFIVVRRELAEPDFAGAGGMRYLVAIDYSESWLNWLLRLLGGRPWDSPGESNAVDPPLV